MNRLDRTMMRLYVRITNWADEHAPELNQGPQPAQLWITIGVAVALGLLIGPIFR